jgi:hypothetical protein|tara:strand:- start:50 stop:268 length:219 start_codon:yes stop_codon:yes gene_type:complete
MAKVRTDYSVVEATNTRGEARWKVLLAREILISTCRTPEHALSMATALNLDPYYLMRGQTRADRAKAAQFIK